MLTWAAAELCAGWRHRRVVLGGGATVILAALIFCARAQTAYWRNSESLWTHTLACTSDNFIRPQQPRQRAAPKGKVDEAIAHYQKALQIKPDYAEAHNNLGNALLKRAGGRSDRPLPKGAANQPRLRGSPQQPRQRAAPKGPGGRSDCPLPKGAANQPDYAKAHNNLGDALLQKGQVDEAITQYQKALQINPTNAEAHNNLGNALLQKGRVDEAIAQYQKALQIKPDSAEVLNNLAWLLATCPDAHLRDGVQAVKYAERACELTHYGVTVLVGTLAAAYAEAGRYDDAMATAQKACALAAAAGEQDLLEEKPETAGFVSRPPAVS